MQIHNLHLNLHDLATITLYKFVGILLFIEFALKTYENSSVVGAQLTNTIAKESGWIECYITKFINIIL